MRDAIGIIWLARRYSRDGRKRVPLQGSWTDSPDFLYDATEWNDNEQRIGEMGFVDKMSAISVFASLKAVISFCPAPLIPLIPASSWANRHSIPHSSHTAACSGQDETRVTVYWPFSSFPPRMIMFQDV